MTLATTTTPMPDLGNGNPGIVPPWLDPEKPPFPKPGPAARIGVSAMAMEARSLQHRARSLAERYRSQVNDPDLAPTIACSLD